MSSSCASRYPGGGGDITMMAAGVFRGAGIRPGYMSYVSWIALGLDTGPFGGVGDRPEEEPMCVVFCMVCLGLDTGPFGGVGDRPW